MKSRAGSTATHGVLWRGAPSTSLHQVTRTSPAAPGTASTISARVAPSASASAPSGHGRPEVFRSADAVRRTQMMADRSVTSPILIPSARCTAAFEAGVGGGATDC